MTRLEQVDDLLSRLAAIRSLWPDSSADLYQIRDECFSASIFAKPSIVLDLAELFSSLHSALLLERTYLIPPAVDDSLQVPCPDHGGVPDDGVAIYPCGTPLVFLGSLPDGARFELGGTEFRNEGPHRFIEGGVNPAVFTVRFFDGKCHRVSSLPAALKVKPLEAIPVEKVVEDEDVLLEDLLIGDRFMLGGIEYEKYNDGCKCLNSGILYDFPSSTRIKIKV